MFRRTLSVPLLATALLASGTTAALAPSAMGADATTKAIQAWQKKQAAAWAAAVAKAQAQYKANLIKNGQNPAAPFVAKGFTVEIPVGALGTQVGGLGVNPAGTGAAVAVGTSLGVSGDLFLVDTIKSQTTLVPQSVSLPFDGSNAVSFDGKRVVFTSGLGILAKPYAYIRGQAAAVPLGNKTATQPSISYDGGTFAFATDGGILGKDTIGIGDPTLGIVETIETASGPSVTFGRPQVSFDGRYIAYLVTTGSTAVVHQFDQATGKSALYDLNAHGLPTGGTTVMTDWSWNSRYFLVTQTVGSVRSVFIVDRIGISRLVTTLPPAVTGESPPTLRADNAAVIVATQAATDTTDTNNATDLAWVNAAGTKYERQSFDASNAQLTSGIGLTPLGQRVPRFAAADTAVAALWVGKAPTGGGETVFVRTTLPVKNPVPSTTPPPTTPPATTP